MAYGRTYRRRRTYRKGSKRTLRKSNILVNRGAKAQSFQIAALNRKVNRLSRATRSEYKQVGTTGAHRDTLYSSEAGSNHIKIAYMDGPTIGAAEYQRVGDKINCIAYHLYGTFEYYNTSASGYHNTESAGAPMRVIILQRKQQTTPEQTVNASDVLEITASSGTSYSCQVMSPLKNGITQRYHTNDKQYN